MFDEREVIRPDEIKNDEIAFFLDVVASDNKKWIKHFFLTCKEDILYQLSGGPEGSIHAKISKQDIQDGFIVMTKPTKEGIKLRKRNNKKAIRETVLIPLF